MAKGGIYVHGWQPRPPFLACSERSLRSRPPELLHQHDLGPRDNSPRPAALVGSFVHHAFQQSAPKTGSLADGAVGNSTKQHIGTGGRDDHRYLKQKQSREVHEVDSSNGSNEVVSGETQDVHAAGLRFTLSRSAEGCRPEENIAAVSPTTTMTTLMPGSDAVSRAATTTVTGRQSPSSDKTRTGCERLSTISAWWGDLIHQAVVFACAHRAHTAGRRDVCRVETHLAALLAEAFEDTACQNANFHGLERRQRQRQSSSIGQDFLPRGTDNAPAVAAALVPNPKTSEEGEEEGTPVLPHCAPPEEPALGVDRSCPSRASFAREFVADVIGEGLSEAVAVALAAPRRPAEPLVAVVEDHGNPLSAVQANTPTAAVDGGARLPEKAAEEQEQQQHPPQQAAFHVDDGEDTRVFAEAPSSDATRVSLFAPGVATASRAFSPTPPTTPAGGRTEISHPSGLQVVRLPTSSALPEGQIGSAAAATGITVEQRARSSSAAAPTNREERRCTPPCSRKRLRNGTFVRIINVPVNRSTTVGHAAQLEVGDSGGVVEARAGARCWRPSQLSCQSSRLGELPATGTVERRRRPETAVLPGVVGIGDGRVSAASSRPPDMAMKREAKSAGATRSAAGVVVDARSGGSGGARVQLRRNRWCSPCVIGDGGSLDLEGSVTSLLTTPSCGGDGGGSSREKLSFPAVEHDTQKISIAKVVTSRRPSPRGQANHIYDAPQRTGGGTVVNSTGVKDGGLSETTRTIYGVAIGKGEAEAAKKPAGEDEVDLSSMKSSERVFSPMSYQYKAGPQGGTELSAAATAVNAAATAAVAAAAVASERSEREALVWRSRSSSLRAVGTPSSGGSVVSTEREIRDGGGADGGRNGGWKVAPPPQPLIGTKQFPLGNSRPGRTFVARP